MRTLLRIDTSSRIEGAYSRQVADYIEQKWTSRYEDGRVVQKDLMRQPVPILNNYAVAGFGMAKDDMPTEVSESLSVSEQLIDELKKADDVLISYPLYNFNMPAVLKAYFDQVIRPEYTFTRKEGMPQGLLKDKRVYLVSVKGGIYTGMPYEALDFSIPNLNTMLNYMGIEDIQLFNLEGTAQEEGLQERVAAVYQKIDEVFNQ
ncbi:MAG: NAD(P)H-dependent oxidoreductase [Flavipsychrobacter sp.]